jgi:hypothetical protein
MAADLEEVLRKEGYGGKNERIAKYMQATFKAHIDARKRLLQEVSSKGRASADVLEAAFDDPMLASGSPVHVHTGDFSVRFKPNTIEVRPQTGKPAHTDTTPSRRVGDPYGQVAAAAPPHFEYPRANLSDLPPVVAGDHEDEFAATVLSAPIIDDDGPCGERRDLHPLCHPRRGDGARHQSRRRDAGADRRRLAGRAGAGG